MRDLIETLSPGVEWSLEADVVVVGGSVAGFGVAVNAAGLGLSVLVLEKASVVGGTGRKAAAWMWVPNNRFMQEKGMSDSRDDALLTEPRRSRVESGVRARAMSRCARQLRASQTSKRAEWSGLGRTTEVSLSEMNPCCCADSG